MRIVLAAAILLSALPPAHSGDVPDAVLARGLEILEQDCGGCHAVAGTGDSALAAAPRFRDLGRRFPIESLAEALAEGIMTGHPDMPERSYEPGDIDAILAYLESIQAEQAQ